MTVSWKVTDDPPIIAHIDVKEENKELPEARKKGWKVWPKVAYPGDVLKCHVWGACL